MNRARKPQLFLIALTALALAALACNLGTSGERTPPPPPTAIPVTPDATSGAGELSQQQRSALIAATVQIYGMQNKDGRLAPIYTGSGTLLSPDGLILTNAHVASPASQGDAAYEPDALVISLVREEDAPAVASYIAELMAVDGYLDLAVIKVSSTLDGSRVQGSQLNLPYVPLGDSNQIHVGDNLNIFGFPGIGGDTITFTKGSVSGFTPEEGIGNRAWIKTDATIAGGNSGGLGADSRGQIIGVPTRASSGAAGEITDCRVVQDTNGDGRLDQQDTCIPIGGFINALRPVELARPLIEAAQSGVEYVSPFGSAGGQGGAGGSGQEQIGNLRWAAGADSNGDPVGLTEAFPAGTSEIYAFFDYAGFTDGQDFSAEWYLDGQMVTQDVSPWDGGSQGTSYLRSCTWARACRRWPARRPRSGAGGRGGNRGQAAMSPSRARSPTPIPGKASPARCSLCCSRAPIPSNGWTAARMRRLSFTRRPTPTAGIPSAGCSARSATAWWWV
ncbi:MAG: trypsin-like peptidase domain-containing protein [Chloroflexi bacterium]|nr:trypsin-like peptidase domain-containing protein [Chloroflexota bacterium]